MSKSRATLTFILEWEDEDDDDEDPRPQLLEILADQSDAYLSELITVERDV